METKPAFRYVKGELVPMGQWQGTEWFYHTGEWEEDEEYGFRCGVCGKTHLKYRFQLKSIDERKTLWSGSSCVKQFEGGPGPSVLLKDLTNCRRWEVLEQERIAREAQQAAARAAAEEKRKKEAEAAAKATLESERRKAEQKKHDKDMLPWRQMCAIAHNLGWSLIRRFEQRCNRDNDADTVQESLLLGDIVSSALWRHSKDYDELDKKIEFFRDLDRRFPEIERAP